MTTIDDSAALPWATYALEPTQANRNALVVHYVPLVRRVAARTIRHTVAELDDLVGAGMLALIRAVERYDPTMGVAFSTFAQWPLRGAMMDTTRRRTRDRGAGVRIVSLDAPVAGTEDRHRDPPDADPGPADLLDGDERWRELAGLVNRLNPRQRLIVAMVDVEGRSQVEAAAILGIDPTWTSRLHTRALRKLQVMAGTVGQAENPPKSAAEALIRRAADGLGAGPPVDATVLEVIVETLARPLPTAS